jgi:putative ABC transport system permease protein
MPVALAETGEFIQIAAESLRRYTLRTSLSVLGVVLGVAAVIAMMSVSEGARREALSQVEALGLENLVARSRVPGGGLTSSQGLTVSDVDRLARVVPLTRTASPVIERYGRLTRGASTVAGRVLGVSPAYQTILRLQIDRGRFLADADARTAAAVCVLGASVARQLFGNRDPIGEAIRIDQSSFLVVGVLREQGADPQSPGALAWRDVNQVAMVPLAALSGRTIDVMPDQPADELWLQVTDGARVSDVAPVVERTLSRLHGGRRDFDLVVPRELLAQRYRTQRTFSVIVGSVAALALLVGGIGIMNIMLTSVVERTREIGVRRTVGATKRDVGTQFLIEALLMTLSGGVLGIAIGAAVSVGITAYAGWRTHVSPAAVALAFGVSFLVGVVFGLYPAIKAANLEPVDALRYE